MIDAASILLLVSATLLLGYVGSLLYDKTKIPDLIWLLGFGILLGPVYHLYDPGPFIKLSSLMSAVALSIILFEAGINVDIKQIIHALPKSMALVGFTFSMSIISVGCFLHLYMPQDFTLMQGLLLGTMVGGTSTVTTLGILSALEKTMDIQSIKVILTLESVLTDPICIVAAITIIQMIMLPGVSLTEGMEDIFLAFGISSIIGLVIGLIWAAILDKLRGRPLNYVITIAVLFLTYIISEEVGGHGAGPVAALLFGLTLTNFNSIIKKLGSEKQVQIDKKALTHFHEEVTFFIKSFFFVYVGLIVSISTTHLITGLILTAICLTIRFVAASIVSSIMKFTKAEQVLSQSIFAHGLPALIMSQLPSIYDPNRQYFHAPEVYPNLCFVIVLGTVLYGALFGPYIAKKKLAPPLAHNEPSRLRLLLSRARYSKRLRIGFGGINLGLGAFSLTALTLMMTGIINPSTSPLGSTLIMALLLSFGVLQIVAGILNVMD